ncbi:hypothetical protein [Roseiconus lacunae]|uniref:hypothetical protein n=1 Tax=Roseiconus lacunae TaxID=2605694 RepID=UPI00135CB38B|nr:hypothetical protein [Roseiconus lacunae]
MTLRSRKKRPTTVPTSGHPTKAKARLARPTRLLLGALVTFSPLSSLGLGEPLFAQQAMAPLPVAAQPAGPQQVNSQGSNLRWRKSSRVTPAPVQVPANDVFAQPARSDSAASVNSAASIKPPATVNHTAAPVAPQAYAAPQTFPQSQRRTAQSSMTQQHASDQQLHARQFIQRGSVQSAYHQQDNAFAQQSSVRQTRQPVIQQTAHTESVPATTAGGSGLGRPQRGPVANYRRGVAPIAQGQLQERLPRPEDFFNDPFADGTKAAPPASSARMAAAPIPVPDPQVDEAPATGGFGLPETTLPQQSTPANPFRGQMMPDPTAPATEQIPLPDQELPAPADASAGKSELRGLLNDPSLFPEQQADRQAVPQESAPAPATEKPPVPTPDTSPDAADSMDGFRFTPPAQLDRPSGEASPSDRPTDGFPGRGRMNEEATFGETSMLRPNELSCEDFRERIARETIDTISLDPSPPFRPDLFDPEDYDKQRQKFETRQSIRPWSNLGGQEIARGRLVGLAYEQVIIETEAGEREEVPVNQLSEGDLGYLADNWGLPKECLVEQVAYTPRNWTPLTMTWKASNLCSKPRYFEQVNLERYGHTAGPWLQPVVSSAHFFANIAVLPYKMGIHPPDECVYALGYYRPGNCAPWIVPPVPISARGALAQGAFMSGAFWLVP